MGALSSPTGLHTTRSTPARQRFRTTPKRLSTTSGSAVTFKTGYETRPTDQNEIRELPPGPAAREFTRDAEALFDKPDTAKLKNEQELQPAVSFCKAIHSASQWSQRSAAGQAIPARKSSGRWRARPRSATTW